MEGGQLSLHDATYLEPHKHQAKVEGPPGRSGGGVAWGGINTQV